MKLYIAAQSWLVTKMEDDEGVISTETAIVGAVILTAALAVGAKFTGLFESAVDAIPDSIE